MPEKNTTLTFVVERSNHPRIVPNGVEWYSSVISSNRKCDVGFKRVLIKAVLDIYER
jgi:hypothetical protein